MAQAGYCSECKSTVWLTAEGACPAGHGAECVSNVYEAPLPADVIAAGPSAASEVGAAAGQTKRWPTSAKVLVGILGAVVVLGAVAVAFVVLRSHTVQPGPGSRRKARRLLRSRCPRPLPCRAPLPLRARRPGQRSFGRDSRVHICMRRSSAAWSVKRS